MRTPAPVPVDRTSLLAAAEAAGVVGAGGSGRPINAVGAGGRVYRRLIVNAAQSEPLFAKDWAALAHFPDCVLDGARLLIEALGLSQASIAVRDEFLPFLPGLAARAQKQGVTLVRLPDRYPLGYDKLLKREVLGPAADGEAGETTLVLNAETVRNLSWAARREWPLCSKLISVAGAVRQPVTLSVPLGTSFADCLALAGGAVPGYAVWRNGALSGKRVEAETAWVDAATLGYLVLPAGHELLTENGAGGDAAARLAARREAFLSDTAAGRPQPMSAACALFGLTSFHRPRPSFLAVRRDDALPASVRLVPVPGSGGFEPCVAAGVAVKRGDCVAIQPTNGGLRTHASVDGVVEACGPDGITIVRQRQTGVSDARA